MPDDPRGTGSTAVERRGTPSSDASQGILPAEEVLLLKRLDRDYVLLSFEDFRRKWRISSFDYAKVRFDVNWAIIRYERAQQEAMRRIEAIHGTIDVDEGPRRAQALADYNRAVEAIKSSAMAATFAIARSTRTSDIRELADAAETGQVIGGVLGGLAVIRGRVAPPGGRQPPGPPTKQSGRPEQESRKTDNPETEARIAPTPKPKAQPETRQPVEERARGEDADLEELRQRAKKDRHAADALWARYRNMSDYELFRRFADEADGTASAVIRQRYPSNEAALRKILGDDYRPPHSATTVLRRAGRVSYGKVNSGGIDRMTPEERVLGFPRSTLATHTEPRAIKNAQLRPGDFLEIRGQYDPCSSCRRTMQEAATASRATIRYWWPGGSLTFQ
jgi:Pput_2613-like deaminase